MTDTLFPVFLLGNAIMKDPYFPGGAGEDQSARALLDAIKQVASAGRGGDELLAYLSPESIQALMSMGGAGTINPVTSLPEFKSVTTQQKVTPPVKPPAAPAPDTVVLPRPSDQLRRLIEAQPAIDAWRESLGSFDDSGRLAGINPVVPASAMGSQGIAVRPVAAPVFGQSAGVAPGAFVSRGINIRPINMPSLPSLGQMASQPSLQNGISTPYLAPYIPQAPAMSRIEMAPMGFAKGGEADVDDMQALADAYDSEDEEAADTDPVGSAQAMLAQLQASDTPSARPMPRLRTSSGGASRPKEMGSEYESLTTARAPEPKGAKSAQAELRALARSLELKKIAAENDARALMRNTLGAPTLRRPGLTKASLSVQRFEKGGEVGKEEPSISGLLRRLGLAVARGVPQAATGMVDLAALPLTATGIRKAEDVVGTTDYLTKRGLLPPPQEGLASESAELLSGMVSPSGAAKAAMLGVIGNPKLLQPLRGSAQEMLKQLEEQGIDTSRMWLRGKKPPENKEVAAKAGSSLSRQMEDQPRTKFNTRGGVWLTDNPNVAQSYTGDRGYVIPVYAQKPDVVLDAKSAQWKDYYKKDKDWLEAFSDPKLRLIEVRNVLDTGTHSSTIDTSSVSEDELREMFRASNLFAKKPIGGRVVNKGTGTPYDFAEGGEVKKNEPGSELWRQIPTDDVPRTAARAPKPAPAKGIVDRAAEIGRRVGYMAKGVTELPYDLAGGAVDLATLAMRPFGYKTEAPVMGSDWIKQKATELGIRPEPPKDFGDRAFFTAGEVLSGFANPATVARRVGPAVEKAVRAGATQVGKQLDRAVMEGTGPLSGVVSQAARPLAAAPSGPGAGPIFSPTPMAESPFVGRIDQFAAALPGPVRKDQLLGQLKAKFRDYEVGRAEEALADLDAANKVTPGDLLNRLRNTYDPSTYKTQIIEPEQGLSGANYQSYDNPYRDKPLGVIHLIQTELPEVPEKARALKALRTEILDSTFRTGALEPEELAERLSNIRQSLQGASPTAVTEVENTFASFAKANDDYATFSNLADDIMYPGSSTTFYLKRDRIIEEIFQNDPNIDPYLAGQIAKKRAKEDDVRGGVEKLATQFDLPQLRPYADSLVAEATEAREDVRELLKQARKPYRDAVSQANEQLRGSLRAAYPRGEGRAYTGQHSSLGNEPNPIAFSRFSEHTATIPGLGKVKGIYVNELQSDRLDDIRKSGPLGGSAQKDLETLYKPSLDRLAALAQEYNQLNSQGRFPRSKADQEALDAISNEMERVSEKVGKIGQRMRTGTYELKESFPGMENSPQVIQQLMAKNVIAAAVNRGDSFVAFPGAESAQSQLYEKLERNLKQVVKDLGPGFEYTLITLPNPSGGDDRMHKAVIWGPEGAARLKKQGVPFKDGGLVDKNTAFIKAHA